MTKKYRKEDLPKKDLNEWGYPHHIRKGVSYYYVHVGNGNFVKKNNPLEEN